MLTERCSQDKRGFALADRPAENDSAMGFEGCVTHRHGASGMPSHGATIKVAMCASYGLHSGPG